MNNFYSKKHIPSVLKDLSLNPDVDIEISEFKESFIKFACLERMLYDADIREELKSYYNRKRMYAYNSKKWIQISKYIFNRDNYTCNYCGQVGGILEVDHIVPFSKGGGDDISNLTTSCRRCNRSKKDMTVEQFTKKYK